VNFQLNSADNHVLQMNLQPTWQG